MQQKLDKRPAGKNADAIGAAANFVAEFGAPVPPPKPSKPSLAALAQVSPPSGSLDHNSCHYFGTALGLHRCRSSEAHALKTRHT